MSHSTHIGFSCPPITSDRGLAFLACVAALALPDFQSRAVGVGNLTTASVSVVPLCRPLLVE